MFGTSPQRVPSRESHLRCFRNVTLCSKSFTASLFVAFEAPVIQGSSSSPALLMQFHRHAATPSQVCVTCAPAEVLARSDTQRAACEKPNIYTWVFIASSMTPELRGASNATKRGTVKLSGPAACTHSRPLLTRVWVQTLWKSSGSSDGEAACGPLASCPEVPSCVCQAHSSPTYWRWVLTAPERLVPPGLSLPRIPRHPPKSQVHSPVLGSFKNPGLGPKGPATCSPPGTWRH